MGGFITVFNLAHVPLKEPVNLCVPDQVRNEWHLYTSKILEFTLSPADMHSYCTGVVLQRCYVHNCDEGTFAPALNNISMKKIHYIFDQERMRISSRELSKSS